MSNIMLYGVLRMPYELAMGDELSRWQFYGRAQEAADKLALLTEAVENLLEQKGRHNTQLAYERLQEAYNKVKD